MWLAMGLVACDLAGSPPPPVDADGDGAVAGVDCDDSDPSIHPDAPEVCNDKDDDCDGMADELAADAPTWHADGDGDGFGSASSGLVSCDPPSGFVADATDCNDADSSVHPGAPEDCGPVDRNCDGATVDGAADATIWYADNDLDGFGAGEGLSSCEAPPFWTEVSGDCDDADQAVHPGAMEKCNGIDDDCDPATTDDDGPEATEWYYDVDDDQYGAGEPIRACEAPLLTSAQGGDCDDGRPDIHPGQPELCDGLDNDCDPTTTDDDAPDAPVWYLDGDGDGFGDAARPRGACAVPDDHVADATDCDDGDPAIFPDAPEQCNGLDDDCDGEIDDDAVPRTWFADADGDGFGDPAVSVVDCAAPDGFVSNAFDCDDDAAEVNPAVEEACDGGRDTDCDPGTAEDDAPDAPLWPVDADGDGYGDPSERVAACVLPAGASENADDCDDGDPSIYPGAPELCDGVDSDCGLLDEPWPPLFADADGDGFGDPAAPVEACEPAPGIVADATDCDDGEESVHPGAPEVCNGGTDDDCDPATSDVFDTFWEDLDGDGYGDFDAPTFTCGAPEGYAPEWGDCDVLDPDAWPGAPESCAGGDDCDDATEPECRFSTDQGVADSLGGVEGLSLGDRLGTSLDAADLDGDGDVELWVGAPGRDAGVGNGGAVWLYADATAAVTRDSFAALRTGNVAGGMIGDAVGLPGDLDGDGVGDLLLGASALGSSGTAMFFSGPVSGTEAASLADTTLTGPDLGARVGAAFGAGDAGGDGVTWAVGAPGATGLVAGSGAVFLLAAPVPGPSDIGLVAVASLLGGSAGAEDGLAVALADLDGDGLQDAVVGGSADRACVVAGPLVGAVALDDAIAVLFAPGAGAALGVRSDLDGDGLVDVLVGAPTGLGGSGAVYGVSGMLTGDVDLTAGLFRAEGDASAGVGTSLDAADADGDGADDLLAGAPMGTSDGARLWYGPLAGVLPEADAWLFLGEEPGEEAGAVVRLVDIDGDGLADVVSASPGWDFFGFTEAGAVRTWSGVP